MTRDYLKAGAMVAALVTMAPAEYQLGLSCGFGHLAAGLPASLDIYTLRALRSGREVPVVALAMIGVNAASHLIAAGHLTVTWYLIVAVSALPVLVLVRVHALSEHHQADALLAVPDVPEAATIERVPTDTPPATVPLLGDFVPLAELAPGPPYPGTEQAEPHVVPGADTDTDTPDTWPLPDGYERAADELTDRAREDFADVLDAGRTPSIRTLRDTYSIGQPRAQRIRDALAFA